MKNPETSSLERGPQNPISKITRFAETIKAELKEDEQMEKVMDLLRSEDPKDWEEFRRLVQDENLLAESPGLVDIIKSTVEGIATGCETEEDRQRLDDLLTVLENLEKK